VSKCNQKSVKIKKSLSEQWQCIIRVRVKYIINLAVIRLCQKSKIHAQSDYWTQSSRIEAVKDHNLVLGVNIVVCSPAVVSIIITFPLESWQDTQCRQQHQQMQLLRILSTSNSSLPLTRTGGGGSLAHQPGMGHWNQIGTIITAPPRTERKTGCQSQPVTKKPGSKSISPARSDILVEPHMPFRSHDKCVSLNQLVPVDQDLS